MSCCGGGYGKSLRRFGMRISTVTASFAVSTILLLLLIIIALQFQYSGGNIAMEFQRKNNEASSLTVSFSASHRKLLIQAKAVETDRIWGDKCSTSDIVITQGPTSPMPNGIPTYTVEISNVCLSGCEISGIHLSCGWFSSARLINPRIFKRLRFDDCLVNDGKPLVNGGSVTFQYANTFHYPLSVSSVTC